ncbi:hypothetical protein OG21DRAFT_376523 [Imleria badia]|nr:hypothetical protein OG21DRAFT_376523 [Imleria badia]
MHPRSRQHRRRCPRVPLGTLCSSLQRRMGVHSSLIGSVLYFQRRAMARKRRLVMGSNALPASGYSANGEGMWSVMPIPTLSMSLFQSATHGIKVRHGAASWVYRRHPASSSNLSTFYMMQVEGGLGGIYRYNVQ